MAEKVFEHSDKAGAEVRSLVFPIPDSGVTKYEPTGKCPLAAIGLMIALGLPIACAIGAAGHFVGPVIPAVFVKAALLLGAIIFISFPLLLIVILVLFLGYPILIGAATGSVTSALARTGKCRNARLAQLSAALCGSVAYLVLAYLGLRKHGVMDLSTGFVSALWSFVGWDWLRYDVTPTWVYVLMALELILVVVTSIWVAGRTIAQTPFCERCGTWYRQALQATVSVESASSLLAALKTGSTEGLQFASASGLPHIVVKLSRCTSCEESDYKLSAEVAYKKAGTKVRMYGRAGSIYKTSKTVSDMTEKWFEGMVSPTVGRQLEVVLAKKSNTKP